MQTDTLETVRRFSRFYTRRIELLGEGILDSPHTLGEVRLLYEIAHGEPTSAADLARSLSMDPGHVSRTLAGLEKRGLLARTPAPGEARRRHIALTAAGETAVAALEAASQEQIRTLLSHLGEADERMLRETLRRAERLMTPPSERARTVVLRPPRPGDHGWVVSRHAALYSTEYRWDETFEAMVAEIVAGYVRDHDPQRERAFIAELDGEPAGSIFLVRGDDPETAKLRLLFVEPWARGAGLGRRLVEAVVAEARALGYRRIVLWTNDILHAARHIYEAAGFRCTAREPHHSFGHDLVGETWELVL